ncbi:protein SHORT-ROOT-like isoform X2 [Cucumis melo]|uniref:Protein SHORT-ROOT-like isoform X2 n=1 Tax=Cucumis melo TaxID=3656 RepID=A0A1S4E1P8_CUCME|nr:protein SHORT-ROOT-like isoform X2 [Cucumis melo]
MDTLLRLVNDLGSSDQYSYNNNSSSSSKNSSDRNHYNYYLQNPQSQECFNNSFMEDEDHFSASSSSSHHHHHQLRQLQCSTTTTSAAAPVDHDLNFELSEEWASTVLLQTAIAIVNKNTTRIQHLMWVLNELGSPYGDIDQKLAFYFLQGMFSRVTDSGAKCYRTLAAALEKQSCFGSMRRMVLKFEEVSPWMRFGHVASNGALMEALRGEKKLHIIDIPGSYSSFCTQWPTFIEALATQSDQTPHLTLTTLVAAKSEGTLRAHKKLMKEISRRLEKFARLMGISFKFKPIFHYGDVSHFDFTHLPLKHDEAVAVNCSGALRSVAPLHNRRDFLISLFRSLRPKIITVVEEEADLNADGGADDFFKHLQECLRWFRLYFDSLDGSFPIVTDERLMLERAAGRSVVDLLACGLAESVERRETAVRWTRRLHDGGFKPVSFSEDVNDDVRALLRRYKDGWTVMDGDGAGAGMFLAWKGQPVVWAAAWVPGQVDGEKTHV